jgi:hypothetical protein
MIHTNVFHHCLQMSCFRDKILTKLICFNKGGFLITLEPRSLICKYLLQECTLT